MTQTCEICETVLAEGDIVFVPADPDRFDLLETRHRESGSVTDGSTWPKVAMCDNCAEETIPVFEWLGTIPVTDMLGVGSIVLKALCRLHTSRPLPHP